MTSLGTRLTGWYALVVMATVVATFVAGYFLLRKELIDGIDLLNAAEFQEIRNRVEVGGKPVEEPVFLERVAEHAEIDALLYFFQVRGPDGEVRFRSPNMGNVVLSANPAGVGNWSTATSGLGMMRVAEFHEGNFRIQIATSLRGIRQFSRGYVQVGALVSGLALGLSVYLGHRLSRLALDPIRRIQQTAQRISADNLSERIPADRGNDEIAGLARLLNQMFGRLENSFERLWRFAGDASHELKTPLSLIRLQAEKLLLQGQLAAAQQEVVQQQLEGLDRLNSVIERLLFLAKSKAGGIRPNSRRQDTAAFLRNFQEDAQVLCEDQSVAFAIHRNEPVAVGFDATLIRQVLLNLLSNALRVTPPGSGIALASWEEDGRWKVSVEDPGPGLPTEQLEKIFEPFARASLPPGSSRPDETGTGLGLAICRSVLEIHHGSILAENRRPGPGLCVRFELPIAPEGEVEAESTKRPGAAVVPAV